MCVSSYSPMIHGVNLTQSIVRKIRCFKFIVPGFIIMSHLFGVGDSSSFPFVEANFECVT